MRTRSFDLDTGQGHVLAHDVGQGTFGSKWQERGAERQKDLAMLVVGAAVLQIGQEGIPHRFGQRIDVWLPAFR